MTKVGFKGEAAHQLEQETSATIKRMLETLTMEAQTANSRERAVLADILQKATADYVRQIRNL